MNNLDLIKQSYCISCDHIKKLNEDYKKYNDTVFNKQFTCIKNKNKENYKYNTNINDIINSSYITKKTCYDDSLQEKDNHIWDLLFIENTNDLLNINFNENTRIKTKLR